MEITTIGLDLAKNVFQVHAINGAGEVVVRKTIRRVQVLRFFERLDPCLVGIEVCGTSHYWDRPGMRTTRRMSRASQPAKQNGTLSADTIRASGHVRPHQQAGHKTAPDQNAKNIEPTLAMREPSTQDIRQ